MRRLAVAVSVLLLFCIPQYALELTDFTSTLTDIFSPFVDENEGSTSFRSLCIPAGGRAESMGCAYTGLADDVSCLFYNPAASSVLQTSQISFFHNSWIADSNIETLAFAARKGDLGFGATLSTFYVPFTEYNLFGSRASSGYYTETTAALNASYNFLSGYNFKGIGIGSSLKFSYRGVPDYADDDSGDIISGSGAAQAGIAFMADFGLLLRFNLAKFYASRDPNVRIGIAVQNLGAGITGFGKEVQLDDPLPTSVTAGISYNFIKPVTISADFSQPFNLQHFTDYQMFSIGSGVQVKIAEFISVMGGFQFKGANPKFSLGAEFEVAGIRVNAAYTLDLTSSLAPVNRFSLSAKMILGDSGRAEKMKRIDELYNQGVYYFSQAEYEKAIEIWEEVLVLDKRFDPAILGIKAANRMLEMFQKIRDSMFLD